VLAASIIRAMMVAESTSETSVSFYQTVRRNNPEDSHLHTRRRENLKSHKIMKGRERGVNRVQLIEGKNKENCIMGEFSAGQ
jgi:hypothetical protein